MSEAMKKGGGDSLGAGFLSGIGKRLSGSDLGPGAVEIFDSKGKVLVIVELSGDLTKMKQLLGGEEAGEKKKPEEEKD